MLVLIRLIYSMAFQLCPKAKNLAHGGLSPTANWPSTFRAGNFQAIRLPFAEGIKLSPKPVVTTPKGVRPASSTSSGSSTG